MQMTTTTVIAVRLVLTDGRINSNVIVKNVRSMGFKMCYR